MRTERKQMMRDCGKAMNLTAVTYGITELLTGLLTTYTATVLGEFADAVLTMNLTVGRDTLLQLLACVLLLAIVLPLLSTLPEMQMFSASLRHERMLFRRFLDKKYSAFRSMDEGDLAYLISSEANEMRITWTYVLQYLIALPFLTAYLLYCALRVSVIFTVIVLAISLLKLLVPIAIKKLRVKYDKQTRTYNQSRRNLEVMLSGHSCMIRIYGIQKGILEKLSSLYENYYKKVLKKSAVLNAATGSISNWLNTFCVLLILVCGVILAANGKITVGIIAAMYGYFTVFDILIGYLQYIVKNIPILGNIFDKVEVLYQDSEESSAETNEQAEFLRLDCENVGFSYGETEVFGNLNLTIKKGEKLLLSGANGSGKTTLLRILCGLEDGYTGTVTWTCSQGGWTPAELRRHAAVVERDDYLFEGTVRENVRVGNPNATKEQVDAVLEQMGISHLADRDIGMDSKNLSGGEQKRVSIARALLKDAELLFLDEPDNGLDSDTRTLLIRLLNETNKTVVLISHDPEFTEVALMDCQLQMGSKTI